MSASGIFPATIWGELRAAGKGDPRMLERVCARYSPPVLKFFRVCGVQPALAEDLSQQVFLVILNDQLLGRADQAKGRFRNFLKGICRKVVQDLKKYDHRQKRDRSRTVSIDSMIDFNNERTLLDLLACDEGEEPEFDRIWAREMIDAALGRLRNARSKAAPRQAEALRLYFLEEKTYAEIASQFGVELDNVKNYVHQGKPKLRKSLEEVVREYAKSLDGHRKEMAHLMRFITL